MDDLKTILTEIIQFRDARDWAQFHTPRQLATALGIEVAELQEIMLWKSDAQTSDLLCSPEGHSAASHELADVLIYALLFAHMVGIDPTTAIRTKLAENARKYPVEKARGNATKYSDLV